MRYLEYREVTRAELLTSREGLTWKQLREKTRLPYERPCATWTKSLEDEIGLTRVKQDGRGNSLVWTLPE